MKVTRNHRCAKMFPFVSKKCRNRVPHKLGFRLDFLLIGVVNSAHAASLMATLDSPKSIVLLFISEDKRILPSKKRVES